VGQWGSAANAGDPGAAGGGMQQDGRQMDALHVMIGGIAMEWEVGPLGKSWLVERIWNAVCCFSLGGLSGCAIAATSTAPSPSH